MDLLEIDFKRSNVKFIVRRSRHISLVCVVRVAVVVDLGFCVMFDLRG